MEDKQLQIIESRENLLCKNDTTMFREQMSQLMRLWYLSHRRPAKAQASLRISQSFRYWTWSMEVD